MTSDANDRSTFNPELPARRDALKKIAAVLIGGIVMTIPGLAGLLVFLNPLRKKQASAGGAAAKGFIDVAPLSALPADGVPRKFQILAERIDAWNKHPASPIGAVYLKRTKDAPDQVVAFNVLCPHANCFVEPVRGGEGAAAGGQGGFLCPCHNSAFNPDGTRAPGCVSPRDLDQLAVDSESLKAGTIRVRFQNFVAGTHEKMPTR